MGKYKCIKLIILPLCDDGGFTVENEEYFVEVDSIWQRDNSVNIIGGEIHLEKVSGESDFGWIEISNETFKECFELVNE